MLANTKVFAPLYACTERKIQSKKSERLKKSENQDFSRRKGADILTYIKPDNTEKTIFRSFERVRRLTHLLTSVWQCRAIEICAPQAHSQKGGSESEPL